MTSLADQVRTLAQRTALLEAQVRIALRGSGAFGDDRNTGVLSASWVPVPGWQNVPLLANGISVTVRAARRTLDVSTSVTLRVVQLPLATVMVTGVAYNADTDWNDEELSFIPTAGPDPLEELFLYQLQIQGSDALHVILGVGRV